ncbi:hypothetical protein FUAX_27610 [Fulvitalea axinellae]|uniref:Carrier domain-containing protein n=1 Tax=Fulvitalea axinellae TaxID=1182444 RepID=A0AAU9CV04_9BACT|nr:hypothetical protein FUAX_27610 [Fulvitalea axinellae]
MGLDSVEFHSAIEENFGVSIPETQAGEGRASGEIADYIFGKVKAKPNRKCLQQIVLYRLRKAFVSMGNMEDDVKPDSIIVDLLKGDDIQQSWKKLSHEVGFELPLLVKEDYMEGGTPAFSFLGIKFGWFYGGDPVTAHTVEDLVDWVASLNWSESIKLDKITDKNELEQIILLLAGTSADIT